LIGRQIFRPGEAEIKRAKGILDAMEEAQRDGQGAVAYEGKMIDLASLRQAETVVRKANDISAKTA
jgi:malyl-CoA/(S)-citramalyl-CoA lyase